MPRSEDLHAHGYVAPAVGHNADWPPSGTVVEHVRAMHPTRSYDFTATQIVATNLDLIEARLATIHIAILARERMLDELPEQFDPSLEPLVAQIRNDLRAYREILRHHAHTSTGHCQSCHLPAPAQFAAFSWPCPAVASVERALLD